MSFSQHHRTAPARPDRGITLIFALIALAVLALAAVGLMRSVDTGARILGNLGFKHDAVRYSDKAAEAALTWIVNQTAATLETDSAANALAGYYSTSLDALDPTGTHVNDVTRALADWDRDHCATAASGSYSGSCLSVAAGPADTALGLTSDYIITRLCTSTGSAGAATNDCAVPTTSTTDGSTVRGAISVGDSLRATGSAGQYYRIIVRTKGARNTVAFTETIVHF